jgi:antitoxin component YwqK of YwqJK toxin-antitoxin module
MKIYNFLIIFLLITACSTKEEKIVDKYDDGSPKKIEVYQQNIKIEEKEFYPNQQLKYKGNFKDGKRDGEWIYYYDDGKVWSEGGFLNDKRHGVTKVYFPNGQLRYRGGYDKGKKTGIWKFYNENGQEIHTIDYTSK